MKRIRFNIASLLGVILVLGVGFAALRESSDLWESGILALTLLVLLTSILLTVHRTEKKRAFWLGFALFGSAYLGLTLVPSIESRLIMTKALAFLDSKMPRSIPVDLSYADFDNDGKIDLVVANEVRLFNSTVRKSLKGSSGTTGHFVRIGHSLLAIVAALLGGQLSRYLDTKNSQGTSRPVPAPVSSSNDSGM